MKKLFFLAYGGGHVNALIPVIKQFYGKPEYEVCAIGINLAAETLRKNGIACMTLSNYMTEDVLNVGHPFAKTRHNFSSTVSYADSISYYGFSMLDLRKQVGSEMAMKVFEIYDRRLFLPIESMKYILGIERPDVVVVTTMHRFEAATILAAKELGIPSVKVEDLVGNIIVPFPDKIQVNSENEWEHYISNGFKPEQLVLRADIENPIIKNYCNLIHKKYMNMRPDRECVISSYVKEKLVERGHKPSDVCITGQPAFDNLVEYKNSDRTEILTRLGLNPEKYVFSFMSQPLKNRQDTLREIVRGIRDIDDLQFIIKLHPNEDGSLQKMILEEENYKACLVKDIPAPVITQISDITSTVSSTTGLEAAAMDKTLIYFNFFDEEEAVPYADMGIGIRITRSEDITPVIYSILHNNYRFEKLQSARREYTSIGNASMNVANIIKNLIGE